MTWHLDSGLAVLERQWRTTHPSAVIGTIAGGGHTTVHTDHMPDAAGSVDACDFMVGRGVTQTDLAGLFKGLIDSRDRRISYAIFRDMIVSSTVSPWTVRHYSGDYHGDHVHLSVNDKHAEDEDPWLLGVRKVRMEHVEGRVPVLERGMVDPIDASGWYHITRAQRLLGVKADGDYGPATDAAVAAYKRAHKLPGDGRTLDIATFKALAGIRS